MSDLVDLLRGGFALEVSGRTGTGRRVYVFSLLSKLVKEGSNTVYMDYASTFWRASKLSRKESFLDKVVFTMPTAVDDAFQLLAGKHDFVVLDSIPRFFMRFGKTYREKWGIVASLLALGLRFAREGGGLIAINYASRGRSFGENIFASYFTHRVTLEEDSEGVRAKLIYPFEEELTYVRF
ncbi:MAG: hypothetical protein QXX32_02665 [Thermofilum sp.]|uniref:KaiC-like domain-containing protein n=2 Tax=Thermofilum adornatum TaxID=1365176 RepID=S5ZW14_9CREN|nr:hypothetical protein [Thermofilum adornatum]AGT35364.1 hypothetical protein N186_05090 [Thermofilum adornatum]AJB41159.1 hypothetical protein TCARB_0081 [Thermofilum adornatum 1505]